MVQQRTLFFAHDKKSHSKARAPGDGARQLRLRVEDGTP
jgi:hypothetical protein